MVRVGATELVSGVEDLGEFSGDRRFADGPVSVDGNITEPLNASVSFGGESYRIVIGGETPSDSGLDSDLDTGLKYVTDLYNKAGKLDVTVLSDREPIDGEEISVVVRGDTIFTGTIRNAKDGIGRRWRIHAYDGIADLKRVTVSQQYNRTRTREIAEHAIEKAGLEPEIRGSVERASPNFDDKSSDVVLERLAKWENAAWWITAFNEVFFTTSIAAATLEHQLKYVRDASPGKRTPAYQSVRVEGGTPSSIKGLDYRHLTSSTPTVATAGEGEPRFTYRDSDIETSTMAQNVADKLYEKLQRQQQGGWVELVGRTNIRPFDTVVMPQTYGGDKYLVSEVKHTISWDEGFVTRLTLGGVVS